MARLADGENPPHLAVWLMVDEEDDEEIEIAVTI
jgi:hypothetical protein